ncbi:MAG TPA: methionine--tRNA ligase [Steroidobacteraceae bacterium]|nr:methionine--tRNA ligase [Steroidobacteraceae bacterium]
MRRILVTHALPYANGPLHLGHLLEAVLTDVWCRYLRLAGHECVLVCADDTHGTPMMLKAQAEGITPEELIAGVAAEHRATYAGFLVQHDLFHSTHSAENREMTDKVFRALDAGGYIARRTIRQAYDAEAQMFLPDRYVKGTCPRCGAKDQYGDSCEVCGATYTPAELIDPVSVVSGTRPVERESEHLFFRLAAFEPMLREWTRSGAIDASVANKLDEWFDAGLRDWDISRDAPYFGFEIPGHPGKYFYVWLDAPIGYMGASLALARRDGRDFDAWWGPGSTAELHHFIGKDILYFHTLFWPAMLTGAGFRRPTAVHTHGFLTVNGQKMSKSRGTFITGGRYLERLPAEPLRYYFAAKLSPGVEDMDLSFDDFVNRFNADVVGKLVNIASRCAGFVARGGGRLARQLPEPALYAEFADARARIGELYDRCDFQAAIREIAALADRANQYIDAHKPWILAKDPARAAEVLAVCTQGINLFRVLMTYLKPVLPAMADRAGAFLGRPIRRWDEIATPLLDAPLAAYEPLATRLDPKVVATLIEAEAPPATAPPAPTPAAIAAPAAPPAEISVEDFARIDLRVARVVAAELVEGADKLLKLALDVGGEPRTVFAGIRGAYEPEKLVGRHVVIVANLKPRKMRFGVSQGMVLAASGDGPGVFLVAPDTGAASGMRVK